MVDNYRQVFLIPSELQSTVKREIELIKSGIIQYPIPIVPQYCHRVSVNEYETQKDNTSEKHLIDLLGIIVRDENMSSKDKKKKLKMVSSIHALVSIAVGSWVFLYPDSRQSGFIAAGGIVNSYVYTYTFCYYMYYI